MVWFKVDDHFHSHRKAKKSGLEAIGLWTVSGSYSAAHLTDGFVEEWFVKGWRRGSRAAALLVSAGLWYETTKDGESGWQFHDWDKHQPTKKQVEAEREKARIRKAQQRLSQGESRRDTPRDNTVDSGEESRRTPVPYPPSRPPVPPDHSLVDLSGELTQVAPSPTCPRHPFGTEKPCGACANARRSHEAWEQAQHDNQLAERRRIREARDNCTLCDENGMRPGHLGLKRCDHRQDAANE